MSPNKNLVRRQSLSSQNVGPGGDSPPELMPSHPLGFLLARASNPNAAPPVLYSFFPPSRKDMDPMTPTSPTPNMANPTLSCPPTFTPSQTVNPRSSQLFLQSHEASPASPPAENPPVLRRQCVTTDLEIRRQELEELARLIEEVKRAEVARISDPWHQICNPPAHVAKQTPKSDPDARNITKSAPSTVGKPTSSKSTASDLFSVAKNETVGHREPSDRSEVDEN